MVEGALAVFFKRKYRTTLKTNGESTQEINSIESERQSLHKTRVPAGATHEKDFAGGGRVPACFVVSS
jgi:hypothetical protein